MLDMFGFETSTELSRSQKIHRENERSNLLVITRLVLRAFLEETMKLRHRMVESDTQQLADLFMMLEKVLWHGFRSSVQRMMIALRSPDAELWAYIGRIASTHPDMNECVRCIAQLENITTPIARIRALLRLAVMQKKLADYFNHIQSSKLLKKYVMIFGVIGSWPNLNKTNEKQKCTLWLSGKAFMRQVKDHGECYEPWALIRQEECVSLSGALVGLSVLDCNLLLDQDHLQEQPPSVDLAKYIRVPSIPLQEESDADDETSPESLKTVLDQKNYLEERNRYLEVNASDLRKKIDELEQEKCSAASVKESLSDTDETLSVDKDLLHTLTKEKDQLLQIASEKEDSIRILKQQLSDTKKVNVDLYEKIRVVEEKCRQFEKELITAKEHHTQEKEKLRRTIEALKSHSSECESEIERKADTSEMLRNELASKTDEYMHTLNVLSQKQEELSMANEKLNKLRRTNLELKEKVMRMPVVEQELADLRVNFEYTTRKLEDYEKALEELGGHLSESKLRMVELKEELLPLSDAQWEKDADVDNCKGCNVQFTVSRRKHHCRNCGSIYCNACSDARVKLPSNAKPARVCLTCYNLLRSRQNSTLTETSSLNSI
uniref:RUN domain-containing protein n=2 Tax=Ascaris TaxID=6251 RepID=A0A0M3HUT5_ASCLU